MKYCQDCGIEVGFSSKRCQPCFHKLHSGKNHPLYGKERDSSVKEKIRQKLLGKPNISMTKFKKGHIPWSKTNGHLFTGELSGNWRGGRIKKNTGYIMVRSPDHPLADSTGYVLEHRIVMEAHLGRGLGQDEVIHHINGVRDDNRIENLQITNQSDHCRHHQKGRKHTQIHIERFKQSFRKTIMEKKILHID